jgi:hypothetical protein
MTALEPETLRSLLARLETVNAAVVERYPGTGGDRQPVHTVYGGAQIFKRDTAARLGRLALAALETYGTEPADLAAAVGLPGGLAAPVHMRVAEKLRREPVEDFRIDFEDGYGNRPDEEEDGDAVRTAREVAAGMAEGTLPPFLGIRVKPLTDELKRRSLRTLDLFLTTLAAESGGQLPGGFVVTLPKVVVAEQSSLFAEALARLEEGLGLSSALRYEVMIETPQAIVDASGRVAVPAIVAAGAGRCIAAHFGTYDYTASVDITAEHQHMTHPACDFARHLMQVSLAGTGVWISDGATNVLPVPPHRAAPEGPPLSETQQAENRRAVHGAWRLHYEHVRHSLGHAFYQGWDLHPAQLPTRYAAVYGFFLESLDSGAERLRNFVDKAAQATLVGDVFDDAATGQGLLNFFLRAVNCGAVSEEEVAERTGLILAEIRTRSFMRILEGRGALSHRSAR